MSLGAVLCAHAQKFQPKTIQFVGAPEYSTQELLDAAGLKPGTVLDYAGMNDHSRRLIDTGMFATLAFKFDGQDLIFTLTPAALYPARFDNFPFPAGPVLETALHSQLPLYHGKVPAEGGMAESVRAALEQMLKAKGIAATVLAAPATGADMKTIAAVSYSITAPPVVIGDLITRGAIVALDPKASALIAKIPGTPYDVAGSPQQIESTLSAYYSEQGYLQVAIHAVADPRPVLAAGGVHVPFHVSVDPGIQYKLAGIQLAPGLLVSQAEFDKQSSLHPGDAADGTRLRENWEFVARQYHNRGYMKARVQPTPALDTAHQTVTYAVAVDPGPQYTMGTLTIDNVTDDLRSAILAAWKMPPGSVFNEGAIRGFLATHGVNPALERVFAAVNCKYTMNFHDDTRVIDLTLTLERKP
ncbi:MAG TPA: POTRA domain-containing protein [Terracidiphilus sp.]|nr:POTRA domain-containing protein [Terracidiphilus sp.]